MKTDYTLWGRTEMEEELERRGYEIDCGFGDSELVEILIETEK